METKVIILLALLGPALGMRLPYIIGGTPVYDATKYPWQGSLKYYGDHTCGCALISSTWAVTAAHCVGSPASHYKAGFGHVEWRKTVDASISKIITHEDYNKGAGTFPNDIALLQLTSAVTEDAKTESIAITSGEQAGNADCYITGWGWMTNTVRICEGDVKKCDNISWAPSSDIKTASSGRGTSYILRDAKINVYTQESCKKEWGTSVNDGHVCVGDRANGRGSCNGDSGGPLVCRVDGSYQLVGVTSWGVFDCDSMYLSVYTRLTYFRDWIREKSGV